MQPEEIKNLITEFLNKSGLHFEIIDFTTDDAGGHFVSLRSNDSRHFLGETGEGLHHLNHLVKMMALTKYKEGAPRILIDMNDFHKQKIDRIKTMSFMMAERARFFKSRVELEPMNAFERHIVHEFVASQSDLSSESTGIGKSRRVVISFKDKGSL